MNIILNGIYYGVATGLFVLIMWRVCNFIAWWEDR